MDIEELQAVLDRSDNWWDDLYGQDQDDAGLMWEAARLVANPNIEAAAWVRMEQDNAAFNEASKNNPDLIRAGWLIPPTEQTKAIVAAALTPQGATDHIPDERPGSLDAPWMEEPDPQGATDEQ